jgi:hypothetical protein
MGDSQGNSAPLSPPEPGWDWDEDGAWDCSGREMPDEDSRREAEAKEARTEALRAELKEMILRRVEAERINAERKVRLEAEREGRNASAGRHAADGAPFSGNFPAAPAATPFSGNYPGACAGANSGNIPGAPQAAPISGNSAAPRDPHAGQIRIGGKLVEA